MEWASSDARVGTSLEDMESFYQDRCEGKDGPWPDQAAMAEHLPFLRDLVEKTYAQQVIEIGVNTGQSTIAFLVGLQATGGKLWSCDIEEPKEPIKSVLDFNWTFHHGPSWNAEAVTQIPFSTDIVFIDGALKNRLTDLVIYEYFVRPGGYILVHDTERPDVMEAVKTFMALNPDYELAKTLENGHGLAVIKC